MILSWWSDLPNLPEWKTINAAEMKIDVEALDHQTECEVESSPAHEPKEEQHPNGADQKELIYPLLAVEQGEAPKCCFCLWCKIVLGESSCSNSWRSGSTFPLDAGRQTTTPFHSLTPNAPAVRRVQMQK